jgi:hypothetical protein
MPEVVINEFLMYTDFFRN